MTVIELRQYTLHPGRRDDLIELFEREFVEPQEAVGIRVIGTFRDLGDPDRFVWIRGFADMTTRLAGLQTFYGGPVWREHREAANATMIDSADVLLLEPVDGTFPLVQRPAVGAGRPGPSRVLVMVSPAGAPAPSLGSPMVTMRTSDAVNDFPALPVRTDKAVVRFARFPDAAALAAARAEMGWSEAQLIELEPTARSRYR